MSETGSLHTEIQLSLTKLGRSVGCDVWVAASDRSKEFMGEKLSSYALEELPQLGLASEIRNVIRNIDVVWLQETRVEGAFEIEHSTGIFSGILRLSDLIAALPNIAFPIFIVAPEERRQNVVDQLRRPTFRKLALDKKCWFISYEALMKNYEKIEFAEKPSTIQKIATRPFEAQKRLLTLAVEGPTAESRLKVAKGRSLEEYLKERSEESRATYERISKKIRDLGNDVVEGLSGEWVFYKRKVSGRSFCSLRPRKKLAKVTVSIVAGKEVNDVKQISRTWGKGTWIWFDVSSLDEIDYAVDLIRQAYLSVKR